MKNTETQQLVVLTKKSPDSLEAQTKKCITGWSLIKFWIRPTFIPCHFTLLMMFGFLFYYIYKVYYVPANASG